MIGLAGPAKQETQDFGYFPSIGFGLKPPRLARADKAREAGRGKECARAQTFSLVGWAMACPACHISVGPCRAILVELEANEPKRARIFRARGLAHPNLGLVSTQLPNYR